MFRLHKQFQNFRYGLESPRACVYLGWLRFALKSNQGLVSGSRPLGWNLPLAVLSLVSYLFPIRSLKLN